MLIFFKKNTAGLLLCVIIAWPSWIMGKAVPVIGGPVFAILIGMFITLLWKDKKFCGDGIRFTSKKILQLAVILLGFGMNIKVIMHQGKASLPIIIVTISVALIAAYFLCKAMKMNGKLGTLVGVGSSICGGSAIAAAAPVIEAEEEEIAQAISVIFLFNVIAALIFPSLGNIIGLSNEGFSLFAGTAVNDTSSVTAAATAWDGIHGSNTLDGATIVKLVRTLAIIPICLALAWYTGKKKKESGVSFSMAKIFPYFIIVFLLAAIVTTVFDLPVYITGTIKEISKFLIIMAMAAIGLNTHLIKLIKSGGKPMTMGLICWIIITGTSLAMQYFMGTM